MRAVVLADNLAGGDLCGEWGLSIYIEYRDRRILLDTGASDLFAKNAEALGLDLSAVDYGVLSHAHYDHGNGMGAFFARNRSAGFYLREGCGENCYHRKKVLPRYIGIARGTLEEYAQRIVYAGGDFPLCPGAWLIPHRTPGLEDLGRQSRMYVRAGLRWKYDDFAHEQSLVLELADGLAVFNSCSHGGAANIIREVQRTFPGRPVRALIGGFHLFAAPEETVRGLARDIRETGVLSVYTGHCTGNRAFQILREELGDVVRQLRVGMDISL